MRNDVPGKGAGAVAKGSAHLKAMASTHAGFVWPFVADRPGGRARLCTSSALSERGNNEYAPTLSKVKKIGLFVIHRIAPQKLRVINERYSVCPVTSCR